jgi:hypothetical protein
MAITSSDLRTHLSIKTGTAGNQSVQPSANSSLGKYFSQTAWTGGVLHDLFDIVSGTENAAENAEYRCIFVYNAHATLTWENVVVWISATTSGGADIAIGVDTTAASAIGSAPAQALSVADEDTAPTGVAFSAPTTKATGLALGNIAAGYCKALWIRRTPLNTGAVDNDSVTISFSGDTAA